MSIFGVALALAFQLTGTGTNQAMRATDVRLDDTFKLQGSDSSGLVLTVRIDQLPRTISTADFSLIIFDDRGKPSGESSCLAIRAAGPAGTKPKPWTLLDDPAGTLSRSYRAQVGAGTAIVEKNRGKTIDAAGVYEFAFLIGPTVKQGALSYGENSANSANVARLPIGSFRVPRPWLQDDPCVWLSVEITLECLGMPPHAPDGSECRGINIGGHPFISRADPTSEPTPRTSRNFRDRPPLEKETIRLKMNRFRACVVFNLKRGPGTVELSQLFTST